jgi:hypothetical protein
VNIETTGPRCEEPGCTAQATKHLNYMPPAEPTDTTSESQGLAARDYHADLCDEHLQQTRARFGGHVVGLAEGCSPACPSRAAS